MIPGYEKIVEERIKKAQQEGAFNNLPGTGKPLDLIDDSHVPEELRLTHKILKNADCLPPEIELKKEIARTEELLAGMEDTAEKYRGIKKLNLLILKLNSLKKTCFDYEMEPKYQDRIVERLTSNHPEKSGKTDGT